MITLSHPLPGSRSTSGFGPRGHVPGLGDLGFHTGTDFAAAEFTPILAAHDGVVTRTWWDVFPTTGKPAGGHMIELESTHPARFKTRYAHMRFISPIPVGTKVKAGDVINAVGQSGAATGPHLHFELLIGGKLVDPLPHIATKPSPQIAEEEEEEMTIKIVRRKQAGMPDEYSLIHPDIGKDLQQFVGMTKKDGKEVQKFAGPGSAGSRKDGKVTVYCGWMSSVDIPTVRAWTRIWGKGYGNPVDAEVGRTDYIQIQLAGSAVAAAMRG